MENTERSGCYEEHHLVEMELCIVSYYGSLIVLHGFLEDFPL